jgi:SAM-dependent methyltransferase
MNTPILDLRSAELQREDKLRFVQAQLANLYGPDNYYTTTYSKEEYSYWGPIPHWLQMLATSRSCGLGKVLDIGPGYGTLAALSTRMGGQVTTLDRIPFISATVAETFGLTCIEGDIERYTDDLPLKMYNTVIMTEVLEHFNLHPLPTLEKVAAHMKKGSMLLLSTPDSLAKWGPIKGQRDLGNMTRFDPIKHTYTCPEWRDAHIRHYSEYEIRSMLQFVGLHALQSTRSTSAGGEHICMLAAKT